MSVNDLSEEFAKDASLLAHMIDIGSDQVLLSKMSERSYKKASFLDRRILTPELKWQAVKWSELNDVELPAYHPPYYIFHIGHVGSTLISRLLGESPELLALREPQILRDLGEIYNNLNTPQSSWTLEKFNKRFGQVVSWHSRTFHADQRAMIKASSFVSNLANDLIGKDNRSLFLHVGLESYLETILAGEGSRQEAEMLAEVRRQQIVEVTGIDMPQHSQLTHIQKIALGWLIGMAQLMSVADEKGDHLIYWQNFNVFLTDPGPELNNITRHFDVTIPDIEAVIAGPIMNRYSKDQTFDYTPDLRRQLLQQARREFSVDILSVLKWVSALANTNQQIEKVMKYFE